VQLSLVYINTLMIQQVLAEPAWSGRLNTDDRRGITPMIHSHINPYGSFRLDLNSGCPSIHRASAHNPKAAPTRAEAWSK
ncbi:MAG TPA: Tn3 family transposase, partial [Edaphobacter sp.]|nr:Tn3 family transposase [Edaphobacter sp.]